MKKKKAKQFKARLGLLVAVCLLMGALGSASAFAATGDIPSKGWDRLIGGGKTDAFYDIAATKDGCTISVGTTVPNDSGESDGLIVKTDDRGTVIWSKNVGGYLEDGLNGVVELADGSLLAAGYSRSSNNGDVSEMNNGARDGWLIKCDADGNKIWDKLIGGTQNDVFADVIATADGGFAAVGHSYSSNDGEVADSNNGSGTSDAYIAKFDSDGNKQWDNLFGSPNFDFFYGVIQTGDGGFVAAGNANGGSNGLNTGGEITDQPSVQQLMPNDALLVKFNPSGSVSWHQLFGGSSYDEFRSIIATSDGGFLTAGKTGAFDGDITTGQASRNSMALVAKFSGTGIAQWNTAFTLGGIAYATSLAETPCGNYIVAGNFFDSSDNGLIANVGAAGNIISSSTAGGTGKDVFNALTLGPDRQIIAAGVSTSSNSGNILDLTNGGQDGLLVYFGQSRYFVNFEENGGTTVANQVVNYGNLLADPITPLRTGYHFEGWYTDQNFGNRFSMETPITEDTTLYANWEKTVNTVTFVAGGGSETVDQSVEYGGLVTEPSAPTRIGYTFEGWFTDSEFSNSWDFENDTVMAATTLYAKWSVNQYTVVFNSRGGSSVGSVTADYDTSITQPVPPSRAGYIFAGWYKENTCVNPWDFATAKVKGNVSLYAKWTPNTYSIKFRGNGASSGTMTTMPMTYNVSKSLTRNAFKKTGYSFLGWAKTSTGPVVYKNMAAVKSLTTTNKGVVTLYAKWGAPIKSVASAGYNKVKITWSYAGSAASYRIYRATSASGKYTLVYKAKSTARSWTNSGLTAGKTYYYKVYPVAVGKVYKHSKYIYAKPIPAAPTVKLTKITSKSIRVAWTGVSGATKYQIYRATGATGKYTLVYSAPSTARAWTNTGLIKGKTYCYKVRAYHLEGKAKVYGKLSAVKYLKL